MIKMIRNLFTKDESNTSSISLSSDSVVNKSLHMHPALERLHEQTSYPLSISRSSICEHQSSKSMESLDLSERTNAQLSSSELKNIKPSTTTQGTLVARVLPHRYSDYDTRKSMARIDPARLMSRLSVWQSIRGNVDLNPSRKSLSSLQKSEMPPSQDDTKSVIALDLYLLRSEFLQDRKNWPDFESDNYDKTPKHLIQSLINGVDLSRNNTSHDGFIYQSCSDKSNVLRDNIFHLHIL